MSRQNIEKFLELLQENTALQGAINAAEAANPENCVLLMSLLVGLGKANGCEFSLQEIADYLQRKAQGELGEMDLEGFAGAMAPRPSAIGQSASR